jgi:hypothetical protein
VKSVIAMHTMHSIFAMHGGAQRVQAFADQGVTNSGGNKPPGQQ